MEEKMTHLSHRKQAFYLIALALFFCALAMLTACSGPASQEIISDNTASQEAEASQSSAQPQYPSRPAEAPAEAEVTDPFEIFENSDGHLDSRELTFVFDYLETHPESFGEIFEKYLTADQLGIAELEQLINEGLGENYPHRFVQSYDLEFSDLNPSSTGDKTLIVYAALPFEDKEREVIPYRRGVL